MNTVFGLLLLVALATMYGTSKATTKQLQEKATPSIFSTISRATKFATPTNIRILDNDEGKVTQLAVISAYKAGPYLGVSGSIAVWQPHVEPDDISLSVVGCHNSTIVTIYAGYGVSPKHFGDDKTRLFLGTKIAGTECLNDAKCSGFVQVDFTHNLGDILDVSDYEDPSKHKVLKVSLERDNPELKWWLSFNSIKMGYIRQDILPNFACESVLWGGIVITPGKQPDHTQMGNGNFPTQGPLKTGEITNAFSITNKGFQNEENKFVSVNYPNCYDFKVLDGFNHFLYGGSGSFSHDCTY